MDAEDKVFCIHFPLWFNQIKAYDILKKENIQKKLYNVIIIVHCLRTAKVALKGLENTDLKDSKDAIIIDSYKYPKTCP